MKRTIYMFLFICGIIIEIGVLTFLRTESAYYTMPMVYFGGGLIASLALIALSFYKQEDGMTTQSYFYSNIIFIVCAFFISYFIYRICIYNPLNPANSDIIPTLQEMVRRVITLSNPYKVVQYPGHSFVPGYLTMQYLPFVLAEKIGMDYRYLAYIIFCIVLYGFAYKVSIASIINLEKVVKIIIPFAFIYWILKYHDNIFIHSIELLDVAYYLLLAFAMVRKNALLIGFAIMCCLLSRYSFLFWLPLLYYALYLKNGKKFALRSIQYTGLFVILLYVIPFCIKEPMLFINSLKNYEHTAVPIWESIADWFPIKKPYVLCQGLSFAMYFNDFIDGSTADKITYLRYTQIGLCLVLVLASILFLKKNKDKMDINLYMLASMKLYFTFFYAFLFLPFSYLYLVPIFMSIPPLYYIKFNQQ